MWWRLTNASTGPANRGPVTLVVRCQKCIEIFMVTNMDNGGPKSLVRRSYDQISSAYRGDSISRDRGYFIWLAALTPLLQPGDTVLDLGCRCGIPVAQELAQRFQVTGVDLSEVQIARARQL